ncbi:MAG: aminopeptidase P family protein [Eubacteriales bacterium]|jgi:Xaa-Pro aminopeptidase|nr:aminopeptidase P family protein [Eubacteriales bacterium]
MKHRIEALRKSIAASSLDAALITSGVNIRYYSGFTSADGIFLVTHKNTYLITDFRYTIQAKAQTNGFCEIVEAGFAEQQDRIRGFLAADECRRAAFEDGVMTVADFRAYEAMPVEWVAFSAAISLPRLHKSAMEIESLQAAQRIADKSFLEWLGRICAGMSELEATAELNYVCAKNGSEGASFDPIIAGGPNGAMPHAVPGERKLQKGDLVVVDFGCVVNGYHSDMTRTFAIGTIDEQSKEIYEIVKTAQQLALDALVGGITGKALDAVARDYIAAKGYGVQFGHGLGHGFGLQIHEPPRAALSSEDTLTSGMTITVEPGIYVEGKCGVRIEDCCVVTESGHINLVSVTNELITI